MKTRKRKVTSRAAANSTRRLQPRIRPLVFISFASADLALAATLRALLESATDHSVRFYFAPRSIPGGVNWQAHIERNLKRARCVIACLSSASATSQWVLFEAGFAQGRGIPVIPVGLRGYKIDRQRPPLSSLQGINLTSASALTELLERVATHLRRTFAAKFTAEDYAQLRGNDASESSTVVTQALLTRSAIYRDVINLIAASDINAQVRATSTIDGLDDVRDEHFKSYMTTLATKCGAAVATGGRMQYHVVVGVRRNKYGAMSRDIRKALLERVKLFDAAHALSRLNMYETPEIWSLNLLLINREHAIIGFPLDTDDPKIQYGIIMSGTELVSPLVDWYDWCVQGRAFHIENHPKKWSRSKSRQSGA